MPCPFGHLEQRVHNSSSSPDWGGLERSQYAFCRQSISEGHSRECDRKNSLRGKKRVYLDESQDVVSGLQSERTYQSRWEAGGVGLKRVREQPWGIVGLR